MRVVVAPRKFRPGRAAASFVLVAVAGLFTLPVHAQDRFRFVNLGVLPGGDQSAGNAVNDGGQVAGSSNQAAGGNHVATRYTGSSWQVVGTVSGYAVSSFGLAINASGHVAGNSNNGTNDQGFFWNGSGSPVGIGFLPGGTISQGLDLNDGDVVAGRATTSGGASSSNRPVTWSGGTLTNLGLPGPPVVAVAWSRALGQGINNSGAVTGYGRPTTPPPGNRPFVYLPGSPGTFVVLGDFGGDYSVAHVINDLGHVAGESDVAAGGPTAAFLWNGTTMTPIPHLPGATSAQALGMNEHDQVVGIDGSGSFLYSGGTTYDLSTLAAAGSPFSALVANRGINLHGQIVGSATLAAGGTRGFLATPELKRTGGSGAWTAANAWSWGLTPAWCHPVSVDGNVTVNGPAADTRIAELSVGTASGPATLALGAGVLTVTKSSTPVTATWASGGTSVGANGRLRFDLTGPASARIVTDTVSLAAGSTLDFAGTPTLLSYVLVSNTGARTGTFTNVTNVPANYSVVYTPSQVRLDKTSPVELAGFGAE